MENYPSSQTVISTRSEESQRPPTDFNSTPPATAERKSAAYPPASSLAVILTRKWLER
jgi:hypothetical protein